MPGLCLGHSLSMMLQVVGFQKVLARLQCVAQYMLPSIVHTVLRFRIDEVKIESLGIV